MFSKTSQVRTLQYLAVHNIMIYIFTIVDHSSPVISANET